MTAIKRTLLVLMLLLAAAATIHGDVDVDSAALFAAAQPPEEQPASAVDDGSGSSGDGDGDNESNSSSGTAESFDSAALFATAQPQQEEPPLALERAAADAFAPADTATASNTPYKITAISIALDTMLCPPGAMLHAPLKIQGIDGWTGSNVTACMTTADVPPGAAYVTAVNVATAVRRHGRNNNTDCPTCPKCAAGFTRVAGDLNAGTRVSHQHTSIVLCVKTATSGGGGFWSLVGAPTSDACAMRGSDVVAKKGRWGAPADVNEGSGTATTLFLCVQPVSA